MTAHLNIIVHMIKRGAGARRAADPAVPCRTGTTSTLPTHPTMRQRLTNGLDPHARAHFDSDPWSLGDR
jgi:hypothetical protein